jgi:juvenile hormone acid methyltransferase
MSDNTKAVNPFLDRIPTELHEQYVTDLMTEFMKLNMAESNNYTDDGAVSVKYGLMVAFARKI